MRRTVLAQERARATRRAIVRAAEGLWVKRDFDKVSVDQVCVKAKIGNGTFFFYFPKKEHLLVAIVFARMEPRGNDFPKLLSSNLSTPELCDRVAKMVSKRVQRLPKHLVARAVEEAIRLFPMSLLGKIEGNRSLRSFFAPIFIRGQKRGEIPKDLNIDLLVGLAGWGLLQGVHAWAGIKEKYDLEADLRKRVKIIMHGAYRKSHKPS